METPDGHQKGREKKIISGKLKLLIILVVLAVVAYSLYQCGVGFISGYTRVRKPEPAVRRISETKESAASTKREETYRRATAKDRSAVTRLLTQLKEESPMVRLAAATAYPPYGGPVSWASRVESLSQWQERVRLYCRRVLPASAANFVVIRSPYCEFMAKRQ